MMQSKKMPADSVVLAGTAARQLWLQSIKFGDTYIARDKTARVVQYLARMLAGLTDIEIFSNLLRSCSLMRKILRFWKPVKALKRIEDVARDDNLDETDRALTIAEIGSDGFYAFLDHFAFFQRIGMFPRLSAKGVDNLDRFIEVFWITEIVPVIWRETRTLLRLRSVSKDQMVYQVLSEKKKKSALTLFKNYCDLLCALYFLMPAAQKNKRLPKVWCGLGGVITSLISIHMNWPHEHCKDE
jgi:hypothetical protein